MIHSMTGYGRAQQSLNGRDILVEIKAVNHRYFEFSSRIPRAYGYLEDPLKSYVSSRVARGKVEVSVSITATEGMQAEVQINRELAQSYIQALRSLAQETGLTDDLTVSKLTRFSDIFTLRKVQEELKRAQGANSDPSALRQLHDEVTTELAHVESAREEVGVVTRDAQASVDAAQTHLWTQKQSLEEAQREADEAKGEYDERKREHDELLAREQEEEKALEERIESLRNSANDAKAAHDEAAERHDAAQALLDEAESVHATPEETVRLRRSIEQQRSDVARQQAEVDSLAEGERSLRTRTRGARLALLAAVVGVVLLLAIVIALVVTAG